MHEKTETKVELHWVAPEKPLLTLGDMVFGTLLVDAECQLYMVTPNGAVCLGDGRYLVTLQGHLPRDFRVVPKVTFHVELEGEG